MESSKTILATTYAVHPQKGSEDGMGWNYVMQIARFNKVIAITRENNRPAIEQHMATFKEDIHDNITFLYFDLPKWKRFWKKGKRGALLYYYLWQKAIPAFVKKQNIEFDIAHNLNFHNDWTPSFLWKLGVPFVWGPIGHHPLIPSQYLKPYKLKYLLKDRLTGIIKKFFWHYSFSLRQTVIQSDFIWCMNSSVPEKIDIAKTPYFIRPSVASQDFGYEEEMNEDTFTVISAGRFVPLKGFDLTVKSFAKLIHSLDQSQRNVCKLILVGDGPEKDNLQQLVKTENISSYVQFISWIERPALMDLMKSSSAFLFPSHEGAGMVVPEALSFGLPVVCLDNCGPGEFITDKCGFAIQEQDYDSTVDDLGSALQTLFHNPGLNQEMRQEARKHFIDKFHWDRRGEWTQEIYSQLL